MKTLRYIGIVFFLLALSGFVKAQDHYISIVEKNKNTVNTIITRTVSIDKVVGDTIYAYASNAELAKFKNLGFAFKSLPYPHSGEKSIEMATTIDQMASWDRYPTYEVYREMMKKFETDYPNLCKLDSIGTTVKERKLYVVKISNNVLADEAEPEFFYTSTMHGDETTGYILMLRLIDHLLANYGTDARATKMVDNIAIFINPNANPDGTYNYGNQTVSGSRRYNANSIDINRNFPDPRIGENPNGPYQPETVAMMNYAASRNFVMSANFHGGVELANFPWDAWRTATNAHADHEWFYTICRQYASLAQANSPSGYFTAQNNGVTQGGDWYVVSGSRQDYMNYWHNCREVTFEISNIKNPSSSELPSFWSYNKEAMLSYIENLYTGIQGKVTNTDGDPLKANISINNHDKDNSFVYANPQYGNYVRLIEPGTWDITYSAAGYKPETRSVSIEDYTSLQIVDVVLTKLEAYNVTIETKSNNAPIQNASVTLNEQTNTTNEDGLVYFANIPEGKYNLTTAAEGFGTFNDSILISSDTTITITLIPLGVTSSKLGLSTVNVWPNPFSNTINIDFTLHQSTTISIELFSIFGQKVATIFKGNYGAGKHTYKWNKTIDLPTGMYLVKTESSMQTVINKILFAPK
ncbi:MAG: M14 family zinc carboxypeptidase [Tenuifilaceae bacterium]|nr:M14 family zinc carboxypeptidase [Tenuifilaceae bacterium]